MLTRTTELAISALSYLAAHRDDGPIPLSKLAAELGSSPTYTSKVLHLLSRALVTRSWRGLPGGVQLLRDPAEITLLEVFEVCQGKLLAYYAADADPKRICAFHAAMLDLHRSTTDALARWTIQDLVADACHRPSVNCLLGLVRTGCSQHTPDRPPEPVELSVGGRR